MAEVNKRGDSYTIRCFLGRNSSGKKIMKNMTWKPDPSWTPKRVEKELERVVVEFEELCERGLVLDGNMTFEKYVNTIWRPRATNKLKATTFRRYNGILKRVIPAIGHLKMSQIQPFHLYTFYDDLRESKREDVKCRPNDKAKELCHSDTRPQMAEKTGLSITTIDCIRAGKSVSPITAEKYSSYFKIPLTKLFEIDEEFLSDRTILHHHRLISTILQEAVYDGVVHDNACNRTKAPRVERKEAKYLEDDEAERLLDTVLEKGKHPFDVIIPLILLTGMRRGECCGLDWDNINFEDYTINICHSLLYLPEKGVFEDDTKTFSSRRVIKVGQDVIDMLADYKEWQDNEARRLGSKWTDSGKVFTAVCGKPINPCTVTAWFHKFVRDNGLPQVSIHSLRHTCASIMINEGVPITATAKRLGHSTPATTSRIYAHAIASADAAAAQTLQTILPIKNRKRA